jgi:hypothetical protein
MPSFVTIKTSAGEYDWTRTLMVKEEAEWDSGTFNERYFNLFSQLPWIQLFLSGG